MRPHLRIITSSGVLAYVCEDCCPKKRCSYPTNGSANIRNSGLISDQNFHRAVPPPSGISITRFPDFKGSTLRRHARVRRGRAEPFTDAAEMPGILLSGAGILRCCALSAVRAEDDHFDATVLLPVVSCLFVIHGLVFAETDDLDAIDGYIVLRH